MNLMPRLRYPPEMRTSIMDAAGLAHALKGRKVGRSWLARCPAHEDHSPSLSIAVSRSGVTLIYCHAGCGQLRVIAALKDRGLWHSDDTRARIQIVDEQFDRDVEGRKEAALAIWQASIPAWDTPVEVYLRSRGITLPIPAALRFHDALTHHPSDTTWPAMIALITAPNGEPVAIHRTYLALDGKGKAPVSPVKMTLGSCRAGAVRLGGIERGKNLAICEGIENGLSVAQACQLPVWAALSADGMRKVVLPSEATIVLVCSDNDANGTGQRAARDVTERFLREGRTARITMPPDAGADFNDLLIKSKEEREHHG
jgi:putative DNA primase/helicase